MRTKGNAVFCGSGVILILWSGLFQLLAPDPSWWAVSLLALAVAIAGGFIGRTLYRFKMTHIGTLIGLFAGFALVLLSALNSPLALDSLLDNALVMWIWTLGGGLGSHLAQLSLHKLHR
ncbi:hypothetical protein JW992_07730 [candidate division KSB1 bacterium]|nr:hypothetical protein [candidate division KSB1 bacterium]